MGQFFDKKAAIETLWDYLIMAGNAWQNIIASEAGLNDRYFADNPLIYNILREGFICALEMGLPITPQAVAKLLSDQDFFFTEFFKLRKNPPKPRHDFPASNYLYTHWWIDPECTPEMKTKLSEKIANISYTVVDLSQAREGGWCEQENHL